MSCDFSTYYTLRETTSTKATEAQAACSDEAAAQTALADAQAALTAAQQAKSAAYGAWQAAEQEENAEAQRLGIEPCPAPPPTS